MNGVGGGDKGEGVGGRSVRERKKRDECKVGQSVVGFLCVCVVVCVEQK